MRWHTVRQCAGSFETSEEYMLLSIRCILSILCTELRTHSAPRFIDQARAISHDLYIQSKLRKSPNGGFRLAAGAQPRTPLTSVIGTITVDYAGHSQLLASIAPTTLSDPWAACSLLHRVHRPRIVLPPPGTLFGCACCGRGRGLSAMMW